MNPCRRLAVWACVTAVVAMTACCCGAGELPVLAGPAFGTTYRVTLAAEIPGWSRGAVHREVEAVLAGIDRAANTWRDDSDVSRFNRAAANTWLPVSPDLVAIIEIARRVHGESDGAFDITVAPPHSGRPSGLEQVLSRPMPPAVRKALAGIELDLGGIGPGYAVDAIGARLLAIGSPAHLVELGGEVRAWGAVAVGKPWRVRLRAVGGAERHEAVVELADGVALATSTCRPGRSPLDPRTGRPVPGGPRSLTVRAESCARADAWAVAAVVLGIEPSADGTITAPSTPAARTGARRADP